MDEKRDNIEAQSQDSKLPVYSDAFYREAPQTHQPSYGYSPAQHFAQVGGGEEPEQPKRHRIPVLITVVCVICALFVLYVAISMMFLLRENISETQDSTAREIYEDYLWGDNAEQTCLPLTISSTAGQPVLPVEEIYESACESTVGVTIRGFVKNVFGQSGTGTVAGGGIILSEDGYILTNYHVIEKGYEAGHPISVITADGRCYEADVAGIEEENDIALLHIDAEDLKPAVLGDPDELNVGQRIYAVGNPLGELTYTMTRGIVSSLGRSMTLSRGTTVEMIQFDAAVNSGNSGGPLYNEYGQVIGVVTAKYSKNGSQRLSFALPIDDVCCIAAELADKGYVSGKPYLGLTMTTVTSSAAEYYDIVQGVYVTVVNAGSAAEEAGLLPGDIITAIDETEVLTTADFVSTVQEGYRAGDRAVLTIWRDQDYMAVTVVFDEKLPGNALSAEEQTLQDSSAFATGKN